MGVEQTDFIQLRSQKMAPDRHPEEVQGTVVSSAGENLVNWDAIQGKLFERDSQQHELFEFYQRSGTVREILLITGPSGSGKTALARSLKARLRLGDAYFITGKCDQIQKPEPFAPFVAAFVQFAEIVMNRSRDAALRVENAMIEATEESEVVLLTDMIPALGILTANCSQLNMKYVENVEIQRHEEPSTKGRPNSESPSIVVFCKFIKALCSVQHPLVILLDDLQRLDSSSQALLQALALAKDIEGLMLIATCRGNEVSIDHPISVLLRNLEEQHVLITDVKVDNLKSETVTEITANLLGMTPQEVEPLAAVTHRMTSGNAFFVHQFLRTLIDKGMLYYDELLHTWSWNQEDILDAHLSLSSARMLGLAVENFSQLSESVGQVLKISSCLGSEFSHQHVQLAATSSPEEVERALAILVQRGLLTISEEGTSPSYSWAHDRFQQAAYSLIPENQKEVFQLQIGMQLLYKLSETELNMHTFLVANLLFPSVEYIKNQDERNRIAAFFHHAGEKASQSSVFETAVSYLRVGIDLLATDHWTEQYALSLRLYHTCTEMEYCLGRFGEVDELVSVVLHNATSLEDQMRAYETKLVSLSARNFLAETIELGFKVLRTLGESFPRKASLLNSMVEVVTTKFSLRNKTADDILSLRPMRMWKKIAALRVMQVIFPAVLRVQPAYALSISARGIRITLRYGLHPMSSTSFVGFGMILASPLGYIDEGYRFGDIGLQILDKFKSTELRCRVHCVVYAYVKPWKDPVRKCLPLLLPAGSFGLRSGDIEIAFTNFTVYSIDGMLSGFQLDQHFDQMTMFQQKFASLQQDAVMEYLTPAMQLARNLLGKAKDPRRLVGDEYDVEIALEDLEKANNAAGVAIVYLCKLFLAAYLGDFQLAAKLGVHTRRINLDSMTAPSIQNIVFLDGLAEVIATKESGRRNMRAGKRSLKKLMFWASFSPENIFSKVYLIEAERYVLKDKRERAIRKFRLAIDQAEEQGAINEQALACERAATALEGWGEKNESLYYYKKARSLYESWGSALKVDQLTKLISGLKK
jgi:histidine kinase